MFIIFCLLYARSSFCLTRYIANTRNAAAAAMVDYISYLFFSLVFPCCHIGVYLFVD